MMEKKKKHLKLILKIIVPILLFIVVILGCEIRLSDGGLYVGNPIFNNYAYTIYNDYAVLEEFKGKEQEKIVIPTKIWGRPVTTIGRECFAQCDNIEKVVLHEKIEEIEGFAFRGCDSLIQVINGRNIKKIGVQAFAYCRKLEKVEFGNQLDIIEGHAFSNCEKLKKIDDQNKLSLIANSAFRESGLESFIFNSDVCLESSVFRDTPWLYNQQEEFLIYGDGQLIFYNGTAETVIIPIGVKILMEGCFDETTAKKIYISNTVTEIEEFAFIACSNVKVYIPESVTTLGDIEREYLIANSDAEITIITTQDSYAYQYAIDHDIPYEIVESW